MIPPQYCTPGNPTTGTCARSLTLNRIAADGLRSVIVNFENDGAPERVFERFYRADASRSQQGRQRHRTHHRLRTRRGARRPPLGRTRGRWPRNTLPPSPATCIGETEYEALTRRDVWDTSKHVRP